tara:strand:- start:214 stop:375 length:162 start_codon:yes stop_codon:yes gene_type:complete
MTPKPSTWLARYTYNKRQCHTFAREHPRKAQEWFMAKVMATMEGETPPSTSEA